MRVLTVDLGSSSIRLALYELQRADAHAEPLFTCNEKFEAGDMSVLRRAVERAQEHGTPDAISHRIVFASSAHNTPARLNSALLKELEAASTLEPLHLSPQVSLVRILQERYPDVPQVLCFDSMFHRAMPAIAHRLPLPLSVAPIERHGYHGLSYEYVCSVLGTMRGRTVIAHLGSGSSMCALLDMRPIETTMGFSPLGGAMMATRPGDLDPGVMLHLVRAGMNVDEITDLLYNHSGMLAISGTTGDMEQLLELASHDPRAREAIDMYVYHLRKQLGALVAVLGGLDMLVFTGGIGEHSHRVREALCSKLRYLGVILSEDANRRNDTVISTHVSQATVWVVRTNESLMLARHAFRALPHEGEQSAS